jgi:hypothetical protein
MNGDFILKLISLTFSIVAITVSIVTFLHVKKDSSTSKTISCLTEFFPEYKKVMSNIDKALSESEELFAYLDKKDFSDFNKVYYSEKYKTFRKVGYFYELLGTMVRQNEINKEFVLYYFSFPIEFFRKTKKIRDIITGENCLPDYWGSFCYLCAFYNEEKKSNDVGGWIVNGEIIVLSNAERKELPRLTRKDVGFLQKARHKTKKANKLQDRFAAYCTGFLRGSI